mgnify:CR=1 FL=1
MEYWNVIIEFDHPYQDDGVDDDILDAFSDWHAVVDSAPNRHIEVTMSIVAETMRQSCLQALALVAAHESLPSPCRIDVLRSDEYDRMNGFAPVPPLVSVTEAAATLGVTRQRVLQMIHEGTVNGFRVGNGWALSHAEIDNMASKKYAMEPSH